MNIISTQIKQVVPQKYKELFLTKTTLVISSGGLHIFDMVGFFATYQESNILPNYQWVVGVSAGSIVGLALICDLNFLQLSKDLINKFKIFQFASVTPLGIYNFITRSYLAPQSQTKYDLILFVLDSWVKSGKASKLSPEKQKNTRLITFMDLYQITGKSFFVILTDLYSYQLSYASYLTTPNLSVADAINASSQIPFIWSPVELTITKETSFYYDGGITNIFPIAIFLPECSQYSLNNILPPESRVTLPNLEKTFMGVKVLNFADNVVYKNRIISEPPKEKKNINIISLLSQFLDFLTFGQDTLTTEYWLNKTAIIYNKKTNNIFTRIDRNRFYELFNNGVSEAVNSINIFIGSDGQKLS